MYTVLNNALQVKGKLSLNNGQGSTAFFSDIITQQMATDNSTDPDSMTSLAFNATDKVGNTKQWGHSLSINVEATDLGTSISTNDYLMYFDQVVNHYYLMKVLTVGGDRTTGYLTIDGINTAIYELGKQFPVAKTYTQANLETVVKDVYKNFPFSIRIEDDLETVIDYTVAEKTSAQAILQDLQTKYDVDVDSWIELDNSGNITERVLYFGHLGSNNGELIRYGGAKGFENMSAQEVSDTIYTKLYVVGQTDDKDPNKGHIASVNNGMDYIVDDEANASLYAIGASQNQPNYLEGTITNTLLSEPRALLTWAQAQMGIFNHPRFNYTVSPMHDQIVGVGDSITVQDFHMKPMILVNSKVIQKTTSFASPETNTFVLGEFSNIFTENANKGAGVINLIKKDVTVVQEAADNARVAADEAHKQAVSAQQQAIKAQTSADGKATTFTVNSVDDLPATANEGDIAWVTLADGTHGYTYLNGKWVEDINPTMAKNITDGVNNAINTATANATKLVNDNAIKTNKTISDVDAKANQLKADQSTFDTKAQGYADSALSSAKANTANVAQQTAQNAQSALNQAKSDLTNGIAKETADRASAVSALDKTAKGYADSAKSDAISAATTADGVVRKYVDDTSVSIVNTIQQNKKTSDDGIATATSKAQQALDGFQNTVSKTEYNNKTGQLQTDLNETTQTATQSKQDIIDIKETDGRQDARMTQIESDASGVKTTVSDLQSAQGKQSGDISTLQQRANGFDATVTKVNNLSVGGTNLLQSTSSALQSKTINTGTGWGDTNRYQDVPISVGQNYTFRVWLQCSTKNVLAHVKWLNSSKSEISEINGNQISLGDTGGYSTATGTAPTNAVYARVETIRFPQNNGVSGDIVSYKEEKFEIGTLPTAWSPAPEDLSSATAKAQLTADNATTALSNYKTDADGRISKAQSDITQTAKDVTTKVSQSDYNKKTGDLTTAVSKAQTTADGVVTTVGNYKTSNDARVKAAESAISQNANNITARVSQTDYNNNNSQLNTRFTKVEATADGASTTVSELQRTVNSLGQTNLINNSDFSPDLGGWTTRGDGNFTTGDYDYSGGVYVVESTSGSLARTNSAPIPLNGKSSTAYSLSFNAYIFSLPSGGRVTFQLTFLDANLNETSNNYPGFTEIGPKGTGNWFNIKLDNIIFTPPAGAAYVVFSFDARGVDTKAGFNRPILVSGSTVGSYVRGQYSNNNKIALQQITIDSISNIVSNPTTGLSTRVQTAEGTLSTVKGIDIPALQNATFWQPYSSLNFNDYTKQGSIFFNTTAAKTNGPTTSNGWLYLIVEQGTSAKDRIKQTAWYDGVTGVKITYVRTLNSGTWSSWYANDNDSVTTISQTNSNVRQEISDRKTGDSNTLQSSKDFTQSSITSYDKGIQTQFTQTASGILAKVGATNLFPNSEFDTDYGYRSKSGKTVLSLATKNNIDGAYNGTVSVTSTAATYQGYWTNNIQVQGGQKYSASVKVHYTNGGISNGKALLDLWFLDSTGARISSASMSTSQVSSPYWVQLVSEGFTAPTNAVYLQMSLLVNNAGAGQVATFVQPMLTATEKLQGYTPNDDISAQLSLFKDNWSIGINDNIGNITSGIVGNASQMSLISKNVTIDSPNTQITGTAWIKSAMIANGAIGTVQIGDAAITSAKIANLDVSKLTGDTITGFNFNVNRSLTVAPGGTISSDIINMTKTDFMLKTNTINSSRTSPNKTKVSQTGIYTIDTKIGGSGSSGTISTTSSGATSPYRTGTYFSQYNPENIYMMTSNYSNGDAPQHMNISSAGINLSEGGAGMNDDASLVTTLTPSGLSTQGFGYFSSWLKTDSGFTAAGNISGSSVNAGNLVLNGAHSLQSLDGGTIYVTNKNGGAVQLTASKLIAGKMGLNGNHSLISYDGAKIWVSTDNGNLVDLGVKSLSQSSLVSLKEHISKVTPEQLLSETLRADIRSYNFTGDDITDKHVTPMIDDVNHEMYIPNDWLSPEGTGVDTYSIIGYLIGSVKALQEQIIELKANQ